jgi:hypothetical protein|tara:strand:+ start:225 stop:389 length:165 start_codon:yes stop_codon:yes gene_type:complete
MIIGFLDIFYMTIILVIFGFIIHLEAQVKTIKTMIEGYLDTRNGKKMKDFPKKK